MPPPWSWSAPLSRKRASCVLRSISRHYYPVQIPNNSQTCGYFLMELDFGTFNGLLYLIGELTVIIIVAAVASAFILVVISLYSIRRGRLYFPRILKTGLVLLEGLMKAMFRFFGLEDRELFTFLIKLHNSMNTAEFTRIPVAERAIFMPQCLRSSQCPAHLTPEGLRCQSCGRCSVGEAKGMLDRK